MRSLTSLMRRQPLTAATYELTDSLHGGRSVYVPADRIACTVSAWLAELGADSPLVEDLARTVHEGNWTAAHAIAELLSIDVAVVAA